MATATINRWSVRILVLDKKQKKLVVHTSLETMSKSKPKDTRVKELLKAQGNNLDGMKYRIEVEKMDDGIKVSVSDRVFLENSEPVKEGESVSGKAVRTFKVWKVTAYYVMGEEVEELTAEYRGMHKPGKGDAKRLTVAPEGYEFWDYDTENLYSEKWAMPIARWEKLLADAMPEEEEEEESATE